MTQRLALALVGLAASQVAVASTCDPSTRPNSHDAACECYDAAAAAVVAAKKAGSPQPMQDADFSPWLDGFMVPVNSSRSVSLLPISETTSDTDGALYGGTCLDADANFAAIGSSGRQRKLAQYGDYARAAAYDVSNGTTSGYWLDFGVTITGGGTPFAQVDDQFATWGTTTSHIMLTSLSAGELLPAGGPPSQWEMRDGQGMPIGMLDASGYSSGAEGIVVHINPENGIRSIDVVTEDGRAHTFFDVGYGYLFLSL